MDSRFAFRKRLELATTPKSGLVRVTADARYQLWVNGQLVGRGPARGYPWAQPYDEHDLALGSKGKLLEMPWSWP